jgi:cell migration-inducing and hyaluronan-binding protein
VPQGSDLFLPSDARPSTFWITNPDNTISDNVAAGSRGFGFWCAFPAAPTGLSTGQPDLPRTTPLRQFSGNSAHSDASGGLNVDDGPRPDGTTETTNYAPRTDPAVQSDPVVAQFAGFRAWKHRGRAVWLRGRNLELTGAILSDNGIGATFAASESFVRQSSFIGRSGLVASLPSTTVLRGFEFYDGRVGADGVRFINYDAQTTVPASALGYNRTNGFPIDPANFAGDVSFTSANAVYLENPLSDRDGDKAAVFLDRDGKVTGVPGAWVAANVPLLLTPACSPRAEWNAYICLQRYVRLGVVSGTGEVIAPLTIQRDDGASLALAGVPNNPSSAYLSAIPGRRYTAQWGGAAPANPRLYLSGATPGDWVRVSLPYSGATMTVIRDYNSGHPLPAAASLADLDASTGDRWYYDAATGLLHLKLVVQAGRDWATLFVAP